MKKIVLLLMIMVFISSVGCTSEGGGSAIGDQAYDFEIEDIDGNKVRLSDFEGKTVFLLAWTTT